MGQRMTAEEAAALDEKLTRGLVEGGAEGGPLTRRKNILKILNGVNINNIITRDETARKAPAGIIGGLVRDKYSLP